MAWFFFLFLVSLSPIGRFWDFILGIRTSFRLVPGTDLFVFHTDGIGFALDTHTRTRAHKKKQKCFRAIPHHHRSIKCPLCNTKTNDFYKIYITAPDKYGEDDTDDWSLSSSDDDDDDDDDNENDPSHAWDGLEKDEDEDDNHGGDEATTVVRGNGRDGVNSNSSINSTTRTNHHLDDGSTVGQEDDFEEEEETIQERDNMPVVPNPSHINVVDLTFSPQRSGAPPVLQQSSSKDHINSASPDERFRRLKRIAKRYKQKLKRLESLHRELKQTESQLLKHRNEQRKQQAVLKEEFKCLEEEINESRLELEHLRLKVVRTSNLNTKLEKETREYKHSSEENQKELSRLRKAFSKELEEARMTSMSEVKGLLHEFPKVTEENRKLREQNQKLQHQLSHFLEQQQKQRLATRPSSTHGCSKTLTSVNQQQRQASKQRDIFKLLQQTEQATGEIATFDAVAVDKAKRSNGLELQQSNKYSEQALRLSSIHQQTKNSIFGAKAVRRREETAVSTVSSETVVGTSLNLASKHSATKRSHFGPFGFGLVKTKDSNKKLKASSTPLGRLS